MFSTSRFLFKEYINVRVMNATLDNICMSVLVKYGASVSSSRSIRKIPKARYALPLFQGPRKHEQVIRAQHLEAGRGEQSPRFWRGHRNRVRLRGAAHGLPVRVS